MRSLAIVPMVRVISSCGGGIGKDSTHTMCAVFHYFPRVLEAPLTHIEPVGLLASYHVFWVEGGVPGFDMELAQDDICDVGR